MINGEAQSGAGQKLLTPPPSLLEKDTPLPSNIQVTSHRPLIPPLLKEWESGSTGPSIFQQDCGLLWQKGFSKLNSDEIPNSEPVWSQVGFVWATMDWYGQGQPWVNQNLKRMEAQSVWTKITLNVCKQRFVYKQSLFVNKPFVCKQTLHFLFTNKPFVYKHWAWFFWLIPWGNYRLWDMSIITNKPKSP